MADINLGHATAYGYARSKGYSGTEEEYAQLMANYGTVGQTATQAAQTATTKASEAASSASNAALSATNAANSAQEAVDIVENIIDDTLTVSGKAADAKVTGDEINNLKDDLSGGTTETSFYSVEQGSGAAAVCKCSTITIKAGEILKKITYYENSYSTSKVFFIVDGNGKILDKYSHSASQNGWEDVIVDKSYSVDSYLAMYVNGMRLSYVTTEPSTPYFSQGLYQTASYTDINKNIGDTLTFTQNVPDRYYSLVAKATVKKIGTNEYVDELISTTNAQANSIAELNSEIFVHEEPISNLIGRITNNVVYSASGVLETNNAVATSDKFSCDSAKTITTAYTISWATTWDENGSFIARRTPGTTSYTPTSSEKIIALSFLNSLGFDNLANQSVSGVNVIANGHLTERVADLENAVGITDNVVVVDVNGNGDYTSLRDCFEDISPSQSNPYLVEIREGTYDIKNDFTAEEWAVESQSFWGLFVPDYVTLRGIGNRERIIITASDTNARSYISTLNLRGTASIENVTVYGNKMRYVIHDDFNPTDGSAGTKRRIKDCILQGENLTVNAVYGSACRDGADWQFENVVFVCSDSAIGFRNHNNTRWVNCAKLKFVNCRMTRMTLSTLSNNANGILSYVSLYGNKISVTLDLNEENASAYGKGCLYKVSGFGNDIALTRIIVTDGGDYSGNIDLIS